MLFYNKDNYVINYNGEKPEKIYNPRMLEIIRSTVNSVKQFETIPYKVEYNSTFNSIDKALAYVEEFYKNNINDESYGYKSQDNFLMILFFKQDNYVITMEAKNYIDINNKLCFDRYIINILKKKK